jgi:uncharacterized protein (DUF1015 family)
MLCVVFWTYEGSKINSIVDETLLNVKPVYDFKAPDGISHSVWILPDELNHTIINEIARVKNLYIADGHHRAASASRARKIKKDLNPNHKGDESYNYFIGVLFPAEQLKIPPYNRVVLNLNGNSKEVFLNKINEKFLIERNSIKEPKERRAFGMYIEKDWYLLKARDSISASSSLSKSVSETLDVSILQDFLLNPILGIDDQRTSKNIDFVGGIRGKTLND